MFEDVWNHRLATTYAQAQTYKAQLVLIERNIEQLLDRIADADVPSIVKAYEDRIRKLETEKAILNEKIARCSRPAKGFGEKLRTALEFLANPCRLWNSERLEDRRTVLKLAFIERLSYLRNQEFRTPNISFPFRLLADVPHAKSRWRPQGEKLRTSFWKPSKTGTPVSRTMPAPDNDGRHDTEVRSRCLREFPGRFGGYWTRPGT
jgi:hypothetical protein